MRFPGCRSSTPRRPVRAHVQVRLGPQPGRLRTESRCSHSTNWGAICNSRFESLGGGSLESTVGPNRLRQRWEFRRRDVGVSLELGRSEGSYLRARSPSTPRRMPSGAARAFIRLCDVTRQLHACLSYARDWLVEFGRESTTEVLREWRVGRAPDPAVVDSTIVGKNSRRQWSVERGLDGSSFSVAYLRHLNSAGADSRCSGPA
jgi:hypothetical protein